MNVLLVDDDFFITTALKTILEAEEGIRVVGSGSNGRDAIRLYQSLQPDVLLMDIRMETMDGLTAAGKILKEYPQARILLLTTFLDDDYIVRALKLGAKGYLLKHDYGSIVPALYAVMKEQSVFGGEITAKIPSLLSPKKAFDYESFGISQREFQVLSLVAEGLSNKEIAGSLFLSEGTVRNYISAVLDKLQLRDRTQLAVFYYQHGG